MSDSAENSPRSSGARARAILGPLVFVGLWSSAFVFAKLGMPHTEPLTFMAVRFVAVTAIFTAVALLLRAPWPGSWRDAGHIAVVGALVHGVYLSGIFIAIARGFPPAVAALIAGLQPVLTAMLAGLIAGERVSPRQWLGALLGFGGVALVVSEKALAAAALLEHEIGNTLICLFSILCISIGTLYQRRFCTSMNLVSGSAIQAAAALTLTGTGAILFESLRIDWHPDFVIALSWLTVVVSLGAFSLLMLMLKHGEATRVASLFYLVPPTAALLAWIFFGDVPSMIAVAGTIVAVAGVALVAGARKA